MLGVKKEMWFDETVTKTLQVLLQWLPKPVNPRVNSLDFGIYSTAEAGYGRALLSPLRWSISQAARTLL